MTFDESIRFLTNDDPLAGSVRRVLECIYGLETPRVDVILSDRRRRVLVRADEHAKLAGFVVWNDFKPQLLLPQNAFSSQEDKALVASDSLAVYSFEQIWWRDEQYDLRRIMAELFSAMSEALCMETKRHALLGIVGDDPASAPLLELLQELEFKVRPNAFADFRVPLVALPRMPEETAGSFEGFELHTFLEPPDPAAMARAFNRVFASGRSEIDAEQVQALWADPSFRPELSLWWSWREEVAAFGWIHGRGARVAEVQLIGTTPEHRRRGLIQRGLPAFLRTCRAMGIEELCFSIEIHNEAPLAFSRAMGLERWQTRRMIMRVR